MPSIKDAVIKQHETFQFVTYAFKDLNINKNKNDLTDFLKDFYFKLTGFKIGDKKKEIKQIKNKEIQYVLFYGDFNSRKGFEYIYNSKDSTPEKTSSFYMFEQTIAPNFHLYFNLNDRLEPLKKNRNEHTVTEIVVYMAQFFDDNMKLYEDLFNQALKLIDDFLKS